MPNMLKILTVLTLLGLIITLYLALFGAGTDIQQGQIQRIFYIHMPSFFGAFTAFGATVIGGTTFLMAISMRSRVAPCSASRTAREREQTDRQRRDAA